MKQLSMNCLKIVIDIIKWHIKTFDAVVIATGHYHAPYVPDLPGLADWRRKWPDNVIHSKQYRIPEQFKDKVGT